jgi:hypothetical protein
VVGLPKRVLLAGVLAIAAVVWLLVNKPVEGRTILVVTPEHGVTEADLPALAILVGVAAVLLLGARR